MKKIYLLPLAVLLFSACDNSDSHDLPSLSDKTYEGLKELNLIYNKAPMVGKSATITGNTLTFDSKIDLGSFSEALNAVPPIPGPGVLPGSPVVTLDLKLVPNKDKYSFSGNGETDFVTYSYLGSVTDNNLDFNFYDVKLKDSHISSRVWKPTPADATTGASPFHIVWETSQPGLLEYFDGSIEDALKLLATLPLIPAYNNTAYMSATQLINSGLSSLSFNADGNLVITYLQSANGAAQFAQAPLCMLQYVNTADNLAKIYINPTDLVSLILINNTNKPDIPSNPFGRASSDSGNSSVLGTLMSLFTPEELQQILSAGAPLLSEGIPMKYTMDATSMEIYLPTEVLVPLIKDFIAPMLAKPEVQQLIIAKLENINALKPYMPMVKGLLLALPLIMETTTKAEIGLSLVDMH